MRPRHAGFTLIEVLVVVVLVGIVTTLAAIRIGHQDQYAEREARRLAAVMAIASRQAVVEARELGLVLETDRYYFSRLEDGAWQREALSDDRALKAHEMPHGLRLDVDAESFPGAREPGGGGENGPDGRRPHVLILSSGEITPFQVEVRPANPQDRAWLVSGGLDGVINYRARSGGS